MDTDSYENSKSSKEISEVTQERRYLSRDMDHRGNAKKVFIGVKMFVSPGPFVCL